MIFLETFFFKKCNTLSPLWRDGAVVLFLSIRGILYKCVRFLKSSPSCFQVWDPGPTPGRGERPADPEGEGRLWQLQAPALQHARILRQDGPRHQGHAALLLLPGNGVQRWRLQRGEWAVPTVKRPAQGQLRPAKMRTGSRGGRVFANQGQRWCRLFERVCHMTNRLPEFAWRKWHRGLC